MRLKRILAILLTLAMVVCLLPATAYAANNTATTMRLAKVQGKVTVSNPTGKAVSQTENMKLYNGYKVKTGAKSYAWISLDDTKVAKLDANSVVEVQKSGKSLTLYVSSGNLFFNAKQPLKGGESFNIKTSTMTTGIRGTSGCVSVVSARVTEINLMTGKLEIVAEHPVLGLRKTAVLLAGQSATSLIDWEAMAVSGEMTEIIIEALTTDDVCGNCAIEIAADPDLLARIEKEAPQLLPALIAALAETKLAADEAADDAKQGEIDAAADAQQFPEDVDPYFEEGEGGGGGGGSSATTPTITEVAVDSWTNAGNDGAAPGLKEQLEAVQPGQPTEISLTNNVTVPAGEDITVDNGENVTLNLGTSTLTLEADPNNQQFSSIVNDGNLNITNTQGYIIGSGMTPAVINNNILTMDDGLINANGNNGVQNNGTFTMTGGEITAGSGAGVENYGTFTMNGGTIDANRGTCVENHSTFTMNGGTLADAEYGISNQGTVTLNSGATLQGLPTGVLQSVEGATTVINGATFDDVSQIASNDSSGTVVTQNSITLKNIKSDTYINNYYGTVNIAGGPIGTEGCSTGIYNYGGTVNISGGSYDVYGGITNMSGGGYPAITNVASGAELHVYGSGEGINSYGDEQPAQINLEGSIIAEDTAKAIIAIDTNLSIGANAMVKAKVQSYVIQIDTLPTGYEISYEDGYFMLAKAGAGSSVQTISDEAAFRSAVMSDAATQNGGALKLGADITVTTEVTASAAKELNIDLQGYTLTFDRMDTNMGKLINTGKLRFVNSGYYSGKIIINGNGDMAAIDNSGELVINKAEISGTSGTLIVNSGILTLNEECDLDVTGDYGIYNTGKLILKTGYITATDSATAIRFAGGKAELTGGEITATGTATAVDVSEGEPTYTAKINTIIQAQTKDNVYKGSVVPEGYFVKDYGYTGWKLVSCLDKDAFIQYVNSYSVNGSSTHQDVVMLGEDMTITASDVQGGMLTMECVSQNSAGAALVIDLGGHTLTLNVPFAIVDHVVITDSVGGGKVNGAAENLFIVKAKELTDYYGTVSYVYSSLTLEKGTIEVTAAGGNGIYLENAENKVILTGGRLTVADAAGYGIYNVNNGTIEGTGTVIEAAEGKDIGSATSVVLASEEPTDTPEGEETDEMNEEEPDPAENGGEGSPEE